ncbi:MAG: radical SAM protein, partial [Deltaproteobacteria bacterium]|nr:radical SAM protein [Deltaproteobacteria bacterium]
DHPYYRMVGFSGHSTVTVGNEDLISMPEFSKLFFIPDCPPIGFNPSSKRYETISEIEIDGNVTRCNAVAAFLEPGMVRSHLPAVDYRLKSYVLPTWGYTAVGFRDEQYWVSGFRIEYSHRWDPRSYDDRELVPAIKEFQKEHPNGPLVEHLINCATNHHCFAAKNLFLKRWEAPLPVSRGCNADCLGCLSFQGDHACEPSHQRISFRPEKEEIVSLAVGHLNQAPKAIVSFGQGCEGEPLTEYALISESIKEIRAQTHKGTINLNTNGSRPERIGIIAESGLDSIRISLNSARSEFYQAYYLPRDYDFEDVVASISLSREMGLYTMINYLIFPGITDQEEEIEALSHLIQKTGVNFIHLKNLNIDPQHYMERMPKVDSQAVGMKRMVAMLREEFPHIKLGYFNQPIR